MPEQQEAVSSSGSEMPVPVPESFPEPETQSTPGFSDADGMYLLNPNLEEQGTKVGQVHWLSDTELLYTLIKRDDTARSTTFTINVYDINTNSRQEIFTFSQTPFGNDIFLHFLDNPDSPDSFGAILTMGRHSKSPYGSYSYQYIRFSRTDFKSFGTSAIPIYGWDRISCRGDILYYDYYSETEEATYEYSLGNIRTYDHPTSNEWKEWRKTIHRGVAWSDDGEFFATVNKYEYVEPLALSDPTRENYNRYDIFNKRGVYQHSVIVPYGDYLSTEIYWYEDHSLYFKVPEYIGPRETVIHIMQFDASGNQVSDITLDSTTSGTYDPRLQSRGFFEIQNPNGLVFHNLDTGEQNAVANIELPPDLTEFYFNPSHTVCFWMRNESPYYGLSKVG